MAKSSIETSFQNLVNVIKEKTYPAASGAAVEADIADIKIDITDLGISKIGISQIGMPGGVAPTSHAHTKSQISDFPESMPASDVHAWAKAANKPDYTPIEIGAIGISQVGMANGVASLGNDGKVPSGQLPAMTIPVTSVNNKTGEVVLTSSDIGALGISQVGMANGVASLDSNGKIPASQLSDASYRYNIVTKSTGGSDASITIKKYLNEELVSSTDYSYLTFDHTHVIIDNLFDMVYGENGFNYTMTLLESSTDHTAGYVKEWQYDETVNFSETFVMSDEDISFIAPPFYANVLYAVGDKVTRNGSFYRCKTPHTGAWDITDFDKISVDELFDEVYDSLDDKANSSDLATVATSGSYKDLTDKPDNSGLSVQDFQGVSIPGLYGVYGYNFWTDGDDIYYSYNNDQYVLNKTTGEWEAKTWTGLTYFDGRMIWTDGTDIYYSGYQDQYVLDKATSTWTAKTWNGFSNLDGRMIWKYDGAIYYSDSGNQYVLDVANSTWIEKSAWTSWGLDGMFIWVFNDTVYSSNGTNQFILDVDNDTLTATTWNISYIDGNKIWTDGKSIYYTYDGNNYVLDEDNMEWDTISLSINPNGEYIWTDGEHTYYSYSDTYEFISNPVMTADSEGNITTIGDITDGNGNTLSNMLPISRVGLAGGVASLDSNGKVPISQIPGSVDEIKEGYLNSTDGKFYEESTYTTEIPAASDKIYVDLSTNLEYRWGGSAYVEISKSIALGRTSSTAFPGDAGKAIEDCMPSNASSSNKLLAANDISTWAKASTKPTYTASEVGAVASNQVAVAGGVASLGNDGKVPSSQLPTISGGTTITKASYMGNTDSNGCVILNFVGTIQILCAWCYNLDNISVDVTYNVSYGIWQLVVKDSQTGALKASTYVKLYYLYTTLS